MKSIEEYTNQEGEILLIDKPYGWTSFDAVKKIRAGLRIKKIGHAGTLDPLATGLLIMCTGKKTKTLNQFQEMEKEYQGKMILGKTTPSFDLETEVDSERDVSGLEPSQVYEAAQLFHGQMDQVPPAYSAIKVGGKRVYEKARKGEKVILEPRKIVIHEFQITSIQLPEVSFLVKCSKGTYIRSLVKDFGEAMKVGAYLSELRRTAIGVYRVTDATSPMEFLDMIKAQA